MSDFNKKDATPEEKEAEIRRREQKDAEKSSSK